MPVNLNAPNAADVRLGVAMAGIRKAGRRDLVLIVLDEGAQVAALFT